MYLKPGKGSPFGQSFLVLAIVVSTPQVGGMGIVYRVIFI